MTRIFILFAVITMCLSGRAQQASDIIVSSTEQTPADGNSECKLVFTPWGLESAQKAHKDFMVYEVPGVSAGDLKASTLTTISSMYSSPKDVVTSLSDNMIQLEGYLPRAYYKKSDDTVNAADIAITWVMQFKDGKIRINVPTIKQIYITGVPLLGTLRLDMTKPINYLIREDSEREQVTNSLNKLVTSICKNAQTANDW